MTFKKEEVCPPRELAEALKREKDAYAFFESLPESYKRRYCDWVARAKAAEIRMLRAGHALGALKNKQKVLKVGAFMGDVGIIKSMDDIPELRQTLLSLCESKSHAQTSQYALLLAEHILERTGLSADSTFQVCFDVNRRWQAGCASIQEARDAADRMMQCARTEQDPVRVKVLRIMAQVAATPHVQRHALIASDYAITLINLLCPGDFEAVKRERLTQIELMNSVGACAADHSAQKSDREKKRENHTDNMARSLLDWYEKNRRDLPWRETDDAYLIWVSEIMAQQTRIAFLLKYYTRFTERFPTVQTLAEAPERDVLKAWEGMGYYRRAKNLHAAAKIIVRDHDGRLPADKKALRALPGIGEYTAGAILSIAFGLPEPAVDGNVLRVFARMENVTEDCALPQTKRRAAAFVAQHMPEDSAGAFTQALMELGALVCTPKSPDCMRCPVAHLCEANRRNLQDVLPATAPRKMPPVLEKTVLILRSGDNVLMRERDEALLGGLWEFFMVDGRLSEAEAAARLAETGLHIRHIRDAGQSRHVFTHMVWEMHGYDCVAEETQAPEGFTWIDSARFETLPMPTALRKFRDFYKGQ